MSDQDWQKAYNSARVSGALPSAARLYADRVTGLMTHEQITFAQAVWRLTAGKTNQPDGDDAA